MKWTVSQAATEFGIDIHTLSKRLKALGFQPKKGTTFHTREIASAVVGDLQKEKILETRERTKALEAERLKSEGVTVHLDEVSRFITANFLPVRQWLLSLPTIGAPRCNPENPSVAFAALQGLVEEALPLIRSGMNRNGER